MHDRVLAKVAEDKRDDMLAAMKARCSGIVNTEYFSSL